MKQDEPSAELAEVAQGLMAEITARLENLTAMAADQQLKLTSPPALIAGIQSVLRLAQAHRELLHGEGRVSE